MSDPDGQMDRRHSGVQLDSVGLRAASTVRIPVCMHSCELAGRRPPLQRKFGFFLAKTLNFVGVSASTQAYKVGRAPRCPELVARQETAAALGEREKKKKKCRPTPMLRGMRSLARQQTEEPAKELAI